MLEQNDIELPSLYSGQKCFLAWASFCSTAEGRVLENLCYRPSFTFRMFAAFAFLVIDRLGVLHVG
jgi:hypothetical protein